MVSPTPLSKCVSNEISVKGSPTYSLTKLLVQTQVYIPWLWFISLGCTSQSSLCFSSRCLVLWPAPQQESQPSSSEPYQGRAKRPIFTSYLHIHMKWENLPGTSLLAEQSYFNPVSPPFMLTLPNPLSSVT